MILLEFNDSFKKKEIRNTIATTIPTNPTTAIIIKSLILNLSYKRL
jgi:hypothetical protein